MLCPVCDNVDMFVLEFEQVEIDYCLGCRGVWLDSGELALIGERAGVLHGELLGALEDAPGRRPQRRVDLVQRHQCAFGDIEVAQLAGHLGVLDHAPAGDGDLKYRI